MRRRPFRAPHHTISYAGMAGGGKLPYPGECSLAHNGVLFLDELPEFDRRTLEVLRQPLEDGRITIVRGGRRAVFPTRFLLTAAMNPCPCGHLGSEVNECNCTPRQVDRYRAKVSGPLLDRIDLQVEVPAVKFREYSDARELECSETVRGRVITARDGQRERYRNLAVYANAGLRPDLLRRFCPIDSTSEKLLETAASRFGLSARALERVIKVSRTIADLDGLEKIEARHVAEAIQYRNLDRRETL